MVKEKVFGKRNKQFSNHGMRRKPKVFVSICDPFCKANHKVSKYVVGSPKK